MGQWTQLWVKAPEGTTRQAMKMIDDQLTSLTAACFNVPPSGSGLPVADADGTYEVRVLAGDPGFVKYLLTQQYRLEIVREQVNG